jgi:tetratricopeptide (TPR) repeat protein
MVVVFLFLGMISGQFPYSSSIAAGNEISKLIDSAEYYKGIAPSKSIIFCQQAFAKVNKNDQNESLAIKARLHDIQGIARNQLGQYPEALVDFSQAAKMYKSLDNQELYAKSLLHQGILYKTTGQYAKAFDAYQDAKEIFIQQEDSVSLSKLLINMGVIYYNLGKFPKALQYYSDALHYEIQAKDTADIALIYYNLGLLHEMQGQVSKAADFYNTSKFLHEKLGELYGKAYCLGSLGDVYYQLEEMAKAQKNGLEAYKAHMQLGNQQGQAESLILLGKIDQRQGKMDSAEMKFKQALEIFQTIDYPRGMVISHIRLGIFYKTCRQLNEAIAHFSMAETRAQALEDIVHLSEIYDQLAGIYSKKENFATAFDYLKKHDRLKDSLKNIESEEALARLHQEHLISLKESQAKSLSEKYKQSLQAVKTKNKKMLFLLTGSIFVLLIILWLTRVQKNKLANRKEQEVHEK